MRSEVVASMDLVATIGHPSGALQRLRRRASTSCYFADRDVSPRSQGKLGIRDNVARELIWRKDFQGWVCSACAWEFKISGPLIGKTIGEMTQNYERQRDEAFTAHVCAKHPKRPAE